MMNKIVKGIMAFPGTGEHRHFKSAGNQFLLSK
jgi:hypothetical protein